MPGHRLEPVRVVRRAVLDGPVLQRARDDVGDVRVERLALGDGAAERAKHVLRQTRPLDLFVERERPEFFPRFVGGRPPRGRATSPIG